MKAGELRNVITLRKKTIAYDSYNQPIETWADAETLKASVITTGGREFYAAQKLNAETSTVFKVRYTKAVNTRMKVKYGNQNYDIISINDVDGKHTELLISAKEVI